MNLCHIVAMSRNRVIGHNGKIPWHIPEDLKHFMRTTLHHPIIMGRGTFESIGSRPLKNRTNIVVSKTLQLTPTPELRISTSLEEALDSVREVEGDVFIVGGQSLYEQSLPITNKFIITYIDLEVQGDTFYPDLNLLNLKLVKTDEHLEGDPRFRICEYHALK